MVSFSPMEAISGKLDSINIAGTIMSFVMGIGILLVLGLISYFVYQWWKNKNIYTQPVRLVIPLENGTKKELNNLYGGKIEKDGIADFEIKMKGFKKLRLGYIPDYSLMDADGRLIFISLGDGKSVQQIKETLLKELEVEETIDGKIQKTKYSLIAEPVPTDVKQATLNNLRNWREILDTKKMTVWAIGIGMFIVMVIAHLVSLYIQTKIKCPVTP